MSNRELQQVPTIYKTIAASTPGNLEFVFSDETVDRMGDVIEVVGWDLKDFFKNPIALFAHSHSFIIGKWSDVRVVGNQLIGKLNFANRGTSARIDELISLVEQGILRAVSVGFQPVQSEPIDKEKPWAGQRYLKQRLLETSLVAVPANPTALQVAKSLSISDETLSLAFGEHADVRRKDMSTGGHADTSRNKVSTMQTLPQRIENAQNDLVAKRDKLTELNAAETLDLDAIEGLTDQIGIVERSISAMKASEAKIGMNALVRVDPPAAPAIMRRPLGISPREVKGLDLIVRGVIARGCAHFGQKSIDQVLDERYRGHEATAIIAKADQTLGTTTVAGWALELLQQTNAEFLQALTGFSIYPALRAGGIGLNFDGVSTIYLPSRTAGGAGGGFVAEGAPIRVGRITTAATTMTPRKLGVIVPFSRELAKRSSPSIEALVRQGIVEDTSSILDAALLDNVASSTARPAGLLNGVAATATGVAGGNFAAVVADFKALLAPFYAANAADNITVIMNPAQGLSLSLMPDPMGQLGWSTAITSRFKVIESTHATANRLIAIRNSDFATAIGDTPEFDISETATVHMEDTTPLEIVAGTPATADPVRSFWQTGTIGVRMIMDISWKMRRSGMISWIDTTTW